MRNLQLIPIPELATFFQRFSAIEKCPSSGLGCKLMIWHGLYGYVPSLSIHHYGFHNSGAGAEGARPTIVEAAEGRLLNARWKGGKPKYRTHPK